MNVIYLVTRGKYSDYSVHGVFADKILAEEYAQQISDNYDTANVEERPIMTELKNPFGFRGYGLLMDCDGNVKRIEREHIRDETEPSRWCPESEWDVEKLSHFHSGSCWFHIFTNKGEEGAIKIANEHRVQIIAENKWPEKGTPYNDEL
jgi:hypothetical protein